MPAMAENRRLFPTPEPVRNAQLEWIEPMLGELLAADFPRRFGPYSRVVWSIGMLMS
jgi:hypothetical protein